MQRVSDLLTSMQNVVGIDENCIYSTYRRILIRHVTLYDFEILKRVASMENAFIRIADA